MGYGELGLVHEYSRIDSGIHGILSRWSAHLPGLPQLYSIIPRPSERKPLGSLYDIPFDCNYCYVVSGHFLGQKNSLPGNGESGRAHQYTNGFLRHFSLMNMVESWFGRLLDRSINWFRK